MQRLPLGDAFNARHTLKLADLYKLGDGIRRNATITADDCAIFSARWMNGVYHARSIASLHHDELPMDSRMMTSKVGWYDASWKD